MTIDDAKEKLPELVEQAWQGDEILISLAGRLVRLARVELPGKQRIAGLNRGEILTSDDFDAPLPDDFWTAGFPTTKP